MGSTMAIEEINAAGGILGCKVEMRFMDDENRAATGVKKRAVSGYRLGRAFHGRNRLERCRDGIAPVLAELKRVQFFSACGDARLTEELVAQKGSRRSCG